MKYFLNTLKIIVGIILIPSTSGEFLNASEQLSDAYNIGIMLASGMMLLLSTWLIADGISKLRNKPLNRKTFLLTLLLSSSVFAVTLLIGSNLRSMIKENTVEIQGIKVYLLECVNGNRRMIKEVEDRRNYCSCIAEKIIERPIWRSQYQEQLRKGEFDFIIREIQNDFDNPIELEDFENSVRGCLESLPVQWSDGVARGMKNRWLRDIEGTDFEQTNDAVKYCDCLIDGLQQFPLDSVRSVSFMGREDIIAIFDQCELSSRK